MMARRKFLLGCAATPLAPASSYFGNCARDRLAFRIVRDGSPIGSHTLDFVAQDGGFDVQIAVDIEVDFGPITLFHYHLVATERWRSGKPISVDSMTNDNGKRRVLRCARESGGFRVTASNLPEYLAPANALPASHWNIAELERPWIDLENGRLLRPSVKKVGIDQVPQIGGVPITAEHYVLTGDATLDLWYDSGGRWASLAFHAQDGSALRYERNA